MGSKRLRVGRFEGISACFMASVVALALGLAPAKASAASPVLEFVPSGKGFPVAFTAAGGEVTAALADFDTVVHCTGSHGEGEIIGPRSTVSDYVFTGCKAQSGIEEGQKCKSTGAGEEELTAQAIDSELVFIDQANRQVGMLLNPAGGVYMNFSCGGESVDASGPFLSPVGPINQVTSAFTASLTRSGATQIPGEYENSNGEKRQAIPTGKRESHPSATTGVELSFAITPSVPLQIKAVTGQEIEAKQREEEAAAVKKRQEAEAAAAAAAKKRQAEEAAAAAASKDSARRKKPKRKRCDATGCDRRGSRSAGRPIRSRGACGAKSGSRSSTAARAEQPPCRLAVSR